MRNDDSKGIMRYGSHPVTGEALTWVKSTFSGTGNCVEIGFSRRPGEVMADIFRPVARFMLERMGGEDGAKQRGRFGHIIVRLAEEPTVLMRDTKDPNGGILKMTEPNMRALVSGILAGELELGRLQALNASAKKAPALPEQAPPGQPYSATEIPNQPPLANAIDA